MRPFLICQITRITLFAAVITSAIFVRPHRRPPKNQATSLESQAIQINQAFPGQTLRIDND
jgi:hypothetical protein